MALSPQNFLYFPRAPCIREEMGVYQALALTPTSTPTISFEKVIYQFWSTALLNDYSVRLFKQGFSKRRLPYV